MKRILIFLIFLSACTISLEKETLPYIEHPLDNPNSLTVANWNLQIFGQKKANNPELLNQYAEIIDDYDIIFIQEIRDKSQTAFPKLCELLPEYHCRNSTRAGRSSSKEQIGIIYKKEIEITNWQDFNPDSEDRWERSPLQVEFKVHNYTISIYNLHTKPDDVQQELFYLASVVNEQGNIMIIGDLNADCSYYNNEKETEFDNWYWVIKDNHDTTTSASNCAYDRIILNNDALNQALAFGIKKDITKEQSDHYLVWIQLMTSQ